MARGGRDTILLAPLRSTYTLRPATVLSEDNRRQPRIGMVKMTSSVLQHGLKRNHQFEV
jgi:hypothetical protein